MKTKKSQKPKKQTKAELKKILKREEKKNDEKWRKDVLFRDNYKCVICGEFDRKKLDVHHLIPRENKNFRWEIDNGIVLCKSHHKFSLDVSTHRNSFVFFIWLKEHRKKQLENLEKKWMFHKPNLK